MKYKPYTWSFNRHMQGVIYTIYSEFVNNFACFQLRYDREIFTLKDGGQLAIEWYEGQPKEQDKRPLLVLISGLGGGTHVTYVSQVIRKCSKEFKCVFVQWRAQGGIPVTSNKLYCMTAWRDYKEVIDYLQEKHCKSQERPMYMYACSLGAICATLYLLNDKEAPIKAAAFYGTPINPLKSSAFFEDQLYGFYNWILGKNLRDKLAPLFKDLEKYSTPAQMANYNKVLNQEVSGALYNIDEYVVAPMFGFKDRFDYYSQSSVSGRLHDIKIPCFFLHSWDDILIDPKSIPEKEFEQCNNLILAVTQRGGHCCHLSEGKWGLPDQWFQEPISEYLHFIKS